VSSYFAACVFTGQEADLDGVCVEHGETACVMTVGVATPESGDVIPDRRGTRRHFHPRRWLPVQRG
jgi:hypothetical protein